MAERKQGPVKPPTIDLTARDATAEAEKPSRRSSARKPEPQVEAVEADPVTSEAVEVAPEVTAADADGVPPPQPFPPRRPTPPEPPRVSARLAASPPWGPLGTAALLGALLGTALTYVLATIVPLPGPTVPNLTSELSAQADRVTTLEQRLAVAEEGTIDVRTAVDAAARDTFSRIAALEDSFAEVRTVAQPVDTSAIEARLRTLTSRVDAIAAGASSADAGAMAENIGDLEVALVALQVEVAALSMQSGTADTALTSLEGEVAALRTEIETAAAEPEPEPQPEPSASIPVVAAGLESAFVTGRPFATELAALAPEQTMVDQVLSSRAETGLVRPDELDRQFAAAVPLMLAARPASGEGWQEAAGDIFQSLLAIRPAGEAEGDSPDAVLSRIEGAMSRHDYAAARDLFAALPPEMVAAAGTVPGDITAHAAAAALVADLRLRTPAP